MVDRSSRLMDDSRHIQEEEVVNELCNRLSRLIQQDTGKTTTMVHGAEVSLGYPIKRTHQ